MRLDQVNWRAKRVLPIYGEMIPWTEMALDDLKQNYPDCQWLFHRARTVARAITGHKTESVYLRYMIAPERDIRQKLARHIESARLADLSEPGTEPAQDPKFKGGEKPC
jgi:hypothetical protein